MTKRGAFIVIEGLDRSGKTTQAQRLLAYLQEKTNAKLIKFPDRTTAIGQMIDSYLKSKAELDDRAIHLLFSANRWEHASTIKKELLAGTTILCDRYAFSGVAFSAAKPSLSYEWCQAPDVLLPAPDLVLFLDVTPEAARKRGGYGEERYEKEEMQLKVRNIFKRIQEDTLRADDGLIWSTIDASRGLHEVEESIRTIIHPLETGVEGEIRKLWSHLLGDSE